MTTKQASIDIHEAAGEGRMNDVRAYLKGGGLIDKRDADRWTPLMMAVREGHLEVAKTLLRSGASIEARDQDKWTAMHVAAANGHPQCCQLLLDRGANPRAIDENKRTPLHWATRYGYAAVVELLLKRGADPNYKDAEGSTSGDVLGKDLSEDAREIVRALLREHEKMMQSTKQRRGSCPAIPRTVLTSAVNATFSATPAQETTPPDSGVALGPLLPVTVVKGAVDHTAETEHVGGGNDTANAGSADSSQATGSGQHIRLSFSAAPHIREHSRKQQQRTDSGTSSTSTTTTPASAQQAPAGEESPIPTTALPTSPIRGQAPRASGSDHETVGGTKAHDIGTCSGETDLGEGESRDGDTGGVEASHGDEGARLGEENGDEVAALKRALRLAEERAREAEASYAKEEELRRREETRVQILEQRVVELEKALAAHSQNGGSVV